MQVYEFGAVPFVALVGVLPGAGASSAGEGTLPPEAERGSLLLTILSRRGWTNVYTQRHKSIPPVFLDRDGTIVEDRGDLSQPSRVVFFQDTVPALRRLSRHFELVIVTNQSGVGNGTISMPDVERVNHHVCAYLAQAGITHCAP